MQDRKPEGSESKRRNCLPRHIVFVNKKIPYIVIFLKSIDSEIRYGIVLSHGLQKEGLNKIYDPAIGIFEPSLGEAR